MTEDRIREAIQELIYTKTEANAFIIDLDRFVSELFTSKQTIESLFETYFTIEKKDLLLSLIHELQVNIQDKNSMAQGIEQIKKIVLQIPIVKLTLPTEPGKETINLLKHWFTKELTFLPFLDITVDSTLLGGCLLTACGYYKDYSVKKKFLENTSHISQMFAQYA